MAMAPVSHEVREPRDLETGRAALVIPTSDPARTDFRWEAYRESGLVRGSIPADRGDHPVTIRACWLNRLNQGD
jgi:hypothetical protein